VGSCRYCGSKTSFFKTAHESCETGAKDALIKLRALMTDSVMRSTPASVVLPQFIALRSQGRLTKKDADDALLQSADSAAFKLARDRPASHEVADNVYGLFSAVNPNFREEGKGLLAFPGYISLSLSNTLFQVLHGQVPYWDTTTPISFRLSSGESPIVQRQAVLAEYRTVSGGKVYESVSLPVGGGIYYRLGTLVPQSQHTGLVPLEPGQMLVTTHAIYFGGLQHNFRLPYPAILRLEPLADGVSVFPNFGSGKVFLPASLGFDDGWFFYNLISALASSAKI
jgi:hypothetical protein